MALHHVADPARTLTQILGLLRPGGALVVAETSALESFPRFLPAEVSVAGAAPGLEDRVHQLLASLLSDEVPELGADWGSRLAAAGFEVAAGQAFHVALAAPLPAQAGRYAQLTLDRLRTGLGDRLAPEDQDALATLVARGPGQRPPPPRPHRPRHPPHLARPPPLSSVLSCPRAQSCPLNDDGGTITSYGAQVDFKARTGPPVSRLASSTCSTCRSARSPRCRARGSQTRSCNWLSLTLHQGTRDGSDVGQPGRGRPGCRGSGRREFRTRRTTRTGSAP